MTNPYFQVVWLMCSNFWRMYFCSKIAKQGNVSTTIYTQDGNLLTGISGWLRSACWLASALRRIAFNCFRLWQWAARSRPSLSPDSQQCLISSTTSTFCNNSPYRDSVTRVRGPQCNSKDSMDNSRLRSKVNAKTRSKSVCVSSFK